MGKINFGRVLIGGLLAGVVVTIGEFILNGLILAEQWQAYVEAHALPGESASMMIIFVVLNFVIGLSVVLLYALIRPRCGAGPKTAFLAGLYVWLLLWIVGFGSMGTAFGVPSNLMLITVVWGLVEVCLAALAGGWAYQEEA